VAFNNATLANGTYCFHNVSLTNAAQLKVNGLVTIQTDGNVECQVVRPASPTTNRITGKSPNFRVQFCRRWQWVVFGNSTNSTWWSMPNTGVKAFRGGARLFALVAGKTITLGNSGAIH